MSFINTDHISKEINEENLQSLQNIYLEIIEQYKEVEVQTHNLSIDQSQVEISYFYHSLYWIDIFFIKYFKYSLFWNNF